MGRRALGRTTIKVTLPPSLVGELDEAARDLRTTRSYLLETAARAWLVVQNRKGRSAPSPEENGKRDILCEPSSELHIAEDGYRRTVLDDVLGVRGGTVE
jgi:metal-responsive CopG/Arc/MetJ family transcriptional regulator